MKIKSILKAIASFFIWGFGQLLNRQYLKALFFFVIFIGFIAIELGTSKYFLKEEYPNQLAYEKLPGNSFGDDFYPTIAEMYAYQLDRTIQKHESYELYLEDLGMELEKVGSYYMILGFDENKHKITENSFIEWLANDLASNNPEVFINIKDKNEVEPDDFKLNFDNYQLLNTKQTLYYNEVDNKYYYRNTSDNIGDNKREYIETTLLTHLETPSIIDDVEGFIKIEKTGEMIRYSNEYYIKINYGEEKLKKLLKLDLNNVILIDQPENESQMVKQEIYGPLYASGDDIFEHYKPGLINNGIRQQFRDNDFMKVFRMSMVSALELPGNPYTADDYTLLMMKIYFAANPDVEQSFVDGYNHFYFDRAGLFLRGYWAVTTLGTTKKVEYRSFHELDNVMLGIKKGDENYSKHDPKNSNLHELSNFTTAPSIPLQGHVSTMLLLEGLIGVILSLFFFIFMIWSIMDAYKTSERKNRKEEIESSKKYFKNVWDNGFEYIVLSPALFVLAFISIMPIAFGFIIAFTTIRGNESMSSNFDWAGLKNFVQIFNFSSGLGESFGAAFWRVLWWTIVWAIFSTFTVFFGGFIQALIINSEKVVFRKLWRTILILPWAIPALLSQMIFSVMFNDDGVLNRFLMNIGIEDIFKKIGILGRSYNTLSGLAKTFYLGEDSIQWFSNPHNPTFVRITLIVVNIWLGFPYFMALMTGVMTAIDKTLYEAADIDGATGFQKVTKITMPLVLYSTAPILIMTFSGNFNNFGVIYFITGGGPNTDNASMGYAGDTDILISWMYKLTVDWSIYNMASVFSVLVFFFVGSITAWNLSRTKAFQGD